MQANVADIVSRQGSFIEGDLTLSVHKLVKEVCTMIKHTSVKKSSVSRADSPVVQLIKRSESLLTKPTDFIPASVKYGESSADPGPSTGIAIALPIPLAVGVAVGDGDGVGVGDVVSVGVEDVIEAEAKQTDSPPPSSSSPSSVL